MAVLLASALTANNKAHALMRYATGSLLS